MLHTLKKLESEGFSVTLLPVYEDGFVRAEDVKAALREDTALVSVMFANNEIGTLQPVKEVGAICREAGVIFHTDAVQAAGHVKIDVEEMNIDMLSLSAHKFYGPKGVGALYLKARTPFAPFLLGGGQEGGRRSGTQNVAGIVGFAAACEAAAAREEDESARLRALRDKLYGALGGLDGFQATVEVDPGSRDFLPNIVHVLADEWESETMVLRFDQLGFCVAGGSACSSHSLEPSHVLKAMGISGDIAFNALRISMGRYTTEADIDALAKAARKVLNW